MSNVFFHIFTFVVNRPRAGRNWRWRAGRNESEPGQARKELLRTEITARRQHPPEQAGDCRLEAIEAAVCLERGNLQGVERPAALPAQALTTYTYEPWDDVDPMPDYENVLTD